MHKGTFWHVNALQKRVVTLKSCGRQSIHFNNRVVKKECLHISVLAKRGSTDYECLFRDRRVWEFWRADGFKGLFLEIKRVKKLQSGDLSAHVERLKAYWVQHS